MKIQQVLDDIAIGGQPDAGQVESLAKAGYRSLVNLRPDEEVEDGLSPSEEADLAEKEGLHYLHFPVSPKEIDNRRLDQFRELFGKMNRPAFVHCASGMRAGVLALAALAVEKRWDGDQTLEKAEALGMDLEKAGLRELVKNYADQPRHTSVL